MIRARPTLQSVSDTFPSKLGLALSGGGFRAAFFHIGVLAQMAERGLLRHVECLSTVSGGSIVGALYYLHVKKLLESKADADITDADFVAIIQTIEHDFFDGVALDLRSRTFWNPLVNLKMSLASYSRSDRIGELYDEVFYRPAWDKSRSKPIQMRELKIIPFGCSATFNPIRDNAARTAKVPVLVINATCLNTGRNWRFEAGCMGESVGYGESRMHIDGNDRYAWPWSYDDIARAQQDFELGTAVAASACVPGIFPALAISGLYPDGNRIELVDGGVHDNQGVQGLFDMGCTAFVVSDASKQLDRKLDPANSPASVLLRVQDILQERVRQEELLHLLGCPNAVLIHMRQGLAINEIPWCAKNGKSQLAKTLRAADSHARYGISPVVQQLLSSIRTDLDAFSEVEATALMFDGYKISGAHLAEHPLAVRDRPPIAAHWGFKRLEQMMAEPTPFFLHQLNVAKCRFGKLLYLFPIASSLLGFVLIGALVGVVWKYRAAIENALNQQVSFASLVVVVLMLLLAYVPLVSRLMDAFVLARMPRKIFVQAVCPALGSIVAQLHVRIASRIFLWVGRVDCVLANAKKIPASEIAADGGIAAIRDEITGGDDVSLRPQ